MTGFSHHIQFKPGYIARAIGTTGANSVKMIRHPEILVLAHSTHQLLKGLGIGVTKYLEPDSYWHLLPPLEICKALLLATDNELIELYMGTNKSCYGVPANELQEYSKNALPEVNPRTHQFAKEQLMQTLFNASFTASGDPVELTMLDSNHLLMVLKPGFFYKDNPDLFANQRILRRMVLSSLAQTHGMDTVHNHPLFMHYVEDLYEVL